jgi:hypothetical protein
MNCRMTDETYIGRDSERSDPRTVAEVLSWNLLGGTEQLVTVAGILTKNWNKDLLNATLERYQYTSPRVNVLLI